MQSEKEDRQRSKRGPKRALLGGLLAGLLAAGLLFASAEVLSTFVSTRSSPLTSVGSTFIDFTPAWMKNFAIDTFGTNDKLVLLLSMAVAVAVLAALSGLIARRKFWIGAGMVVAFAVVMVICILTRAGARPVDVLPVVVGTLLGLAALRWLTPPVHSANNADSATEQALPSRRTFLVRGALVAGVGVVLAISANALSTARNTALTVRNALKLPAPKTPATPLPAGVQVDVAGVTPFVSPNDGFYRIDTALVVPQVDPSGWELRVHGMVENEITMSFDELLAQELIEEYVTLTCVSNVVGGNLAGNAKWLGYPLREILAKAKPTQGADMVLSTSVDGFSASTPLEVLQDDRPALLAVGMNDQPLPLEHGFPVRMVVPGLYGFVSATKWVVDLEVTTFAQKQGYWTSRGWSSHGPIKTSSRVEVPKALARIPAGKISIGGSAWAQTRGIAKVEVSLDNGPWVEAELGAQANLDTWRQWKYVWNTSETGTHQVKVRATDKTGQLQIEKQAPPQPDGSTGWHSITFSVV